MKYYSSLPASALVAVLILGALIHWQVIPPGMALLEALRSSFEGYSNLLIFLIILLEAIVYIGFYFPGQFFAVVLVVLAEPSWQDILWLTIAMVAAATLASFINFYLGRYVIGGKGEGGEVSAKQLLLAMIHINSLAFFMVAQGASGRSSKVVWLAGLLNLPYYLMLISATSLLSEQVMYVAESDWLLILILGLWLLLAIFLDWRRYTNPLK